VSLIRVLYTIPDLCVGGAERQLVALAGGLDRRRFAPAIAVLRPGGMLESEARDAGVEVIPAPRRARLDPLPALRLASYVRRRGVDVVHTSLFLDGVYGRVAGVLGGARVRVASLLGIDYAKGSMRWRLDRLLGRVTSCLAVNSAWMRREAEARGLACGRTEVIPNGVDADRFAGGDRAAARRELGLGEGDFVVAAVGRLSPEKDHATLLRCAARVAQACARARFVIAGDGPARPALERMVAELGLAGRVVMAGWRLDVRPVLWAADALALTSRSESFPNAVLEAMAAGLPVVATRVGGVPEMVREGETGLLAEAGDAAGLARHLLRLEADPGMRARMGEAGRARARDEFPLSAMVRRYERLYERLLGMR